MSFRVIPLRLYRVAVERVSEEQKNFYAKVARLIGPSSPDVSIPETTIPLDRARCSNNDAVTEAIMDGYARPSERPQCLILDLTNPRTKLLPDHHVIGGLLGFFDSIASEQQDLVMVILMPIILAEKDITRRALQPYLDQGKIGLIADDGSTCGASTLLNGFNGKAYAQALHDVRPSPRWRLNRKMIRRPGHYKRMSLGRHDHCLPYFFDGRLCQEELVELIWEHALRHFRGDRTPTIVYHCPESRWLYDAVQSVCQEHNLPKVDADELLRDRTGSLAVPDLCLLVVPLIDTKETLRRLLDAFLTRNPSIDIAILSIITTHSISDTSEESQVYEAFGHQVPISCLMHHDRPRLNPGECPACRAQMGQTDPNQPEQYLKLTSYATWNMFLDSGLIDEKNVPSYRPPLGLMPNLQKLVNDNSPYLALKINTLLKSRRGGLPLDPVILYPLEREESGSAAIAESLVSLYDYTLIGVPRDILDRYNDEKNLLEMLDETEKHREWFLGISSLPSGSEVILMDEFNMSGNTRARLHHLARLFGLRVCSYFCLIDFVPRASQPWDLDCLSLYDLEISAAA